MNITGRTGNYLVLSALQTAIVCPDTPYSPKRRVEINKENEMDVLNDMERKKEVLYKDTGESLLIRAFGKTPKLRIIDLFMTNPHFDFSREEVARELGMSKRTLYKNFKDLEELGIVIVTRKIGRAVMYKIDTEHPLPKKMEKDR